MGIKKAVFPIAGLGTRFLPITKSIPKEMLPILNKPIIEWTIKEAVDSGIETAIMITSKYKSAIENYFDSFTELEETLKSQNKLELLEEIKSIEEMVKLVSIRQRKTLGLGHAVLCSKIAVGSDDFVVVLPDDVIFGEKPVIRQLIEVYEETKNPVIAIKEVPWEDVKSYGIVKVREVSDRLYIVEDLIEKPQKEEAPSNLAIIGRYILTNDIFDKLEKTPPGKNGEIQLTDALKMLIKDRPIYAYKFEGCHFDCGQKLGFILANLFIALRDKELREPILNFLRENT
ncbi:MAG: UTP--glucose-1-phosphate uridylyltransferase GalU [Thermosulfidibacteraceae bacterium]|jgi:UTP--glucose-1-phosphate uridylyltransferase